MKKLQEEKFLIAETGRSPRRNRGTGDVMESNCDWYAQPLSMLKTSAAYVSEGLRDEFEVQGEEDYLGDGVLGGSTGGGIGYGSMAHSGGASLSPEKRAPLICEDHLPDSDIDIARGAKGSTAEDGSSFPRRKKRYRSRAYGWFRAIAWRMGMDFLAAWLDEVRNRTDVVVDSVTRPSMSSTGFVTFRTLTPVTVTTSAPLTYNRNPMEVSVAPEPRDIVWTNVQIDRDIGSSRAFIANVLLGAGVVLWSIPLTLIQAWAKVETVALIPGFEWVEQIHGGALKPLINGYLPVITLLGLILLLPLIFNAIATSYEKRKTLSGVQNSIVGRYFYYQARLLLQFALRAITLIPLTHNASALSSLQLANIYITVTAGAIWTSLADIIDHPQNLLLILGEDLPKLAGYFISLLITKTVRKRVRTLLYLRHRPECCSLLITACILSFVELNPACWLADGSAAHRSTQPHDVLAVLLQQKASNDARAEGSLSSSTDILWLGVSDAVLGHNHLLHLRMHDTVCALLRKHVLFRCLAGVQEASLVCLHSNIRKRRENVPSSS